MSEKSSNFSESGMSIVKKWGYEGTKKKESKNGVLFPVEEFLKDSKEKLSEMALGLGIGGGAGCGFGLGFGLTGGVGYGRSPWNHSQLAFGIGGGCGFGVGVGYGFGVGYGQLLSDLAKSNKPDNAMRKKMLIGI